MSVSGRVVGALGLLSLAWAAGVTAIDRYGLTDRAQPADVIVVFGSRVLWNGQPGPSLSRRAAHAAALYRQGLAPRVICSGGVGVGTVSEAQAACDRAVSLGVPAGVVLLEESARSTEETALYVAAIMRAHDWQTAILVSDGYHLYRSQLLFQRAGVTPYPSPAQALAGPMYPMERFGRANRELAALVWYWGKSLLGLPITDFDSWRDVGRQARLRHAGALADSPFFAEVMETIETRRSAERRGTQADWKVCPTV